MERDEEKASAPRLRRGCGECRVRQNEGSGRRTNPIRRRDRAHHRGLEGEGEGSKAYKEFKSYLETPGTAINAKYGWKRHDPKLREKLREEAQDEIGLLNHKLRTGEWVNDVAEGKPSSVMDAMMKMEEPRDSIAMMDRMSEYDTLPPQEPS